MTKNYVGVTGIATVKDADELNDVARIVHADKTRIMAGILVSYKSLQDIENTRKRYPDLKDIHPIAKRLHEYGFFTVMHYNTRNQDGFDHELQDVFDTFNLHGMVDGVQLNISNPSKDAIKRLHEHFGDDFSIILQLNSSFVKKGKDYIQEFVHDMKDYITYTIIDLSGGRGKEMNVDTCVEIYNVIKDNTRVVFAGGLHPDNVEKIRAEIVTAIGNDNFSVDAESGLRTDDELDRSKFAPYINHFFPIVL